MRIVTLGAPGSGKRTQTSLLASRYGLVILTSGELVKHAMAEESERGAHLRLLQQAGQGVTDDVVLGLLQERLVQPDLDAGFILDGFPRNLLQALTLDEILAEIELSLDFVLLFHIETDTLMERLVGRRTCRSCGAVYNIYTNPSVVEDVCDDCGGRLHQRSDDTEETVSNRLHVFDHLTSPLLSHYGKQGKLLRIDGDGEVDEVFSRTCETIDAFFKRAESEAPSETPPREEIPDEIPESGLGASENMSVSDGAAHRVAEASSAKPGEAAQAASRNAGPRKKKGVAAVKPAAEGRATVKQKPKMSIAKTSPAKPGKGAGKARTGKVGGGESRGVAASGRASAKALPAQGQRKPAPAGGVKGKAKASAPRKSAKTIRTKPITAKPRSDAKQGGSPVPGKPAASRPASKRVVAKKAAATAKSQPSKAVKKKAATGKAVAKKKVAAKPAPKKAAKKSASVQKRKPPGQSPKRTVKKSGDAMAKKKAGKPLNRSAARARH